MKNTTAQVILRPEALQRASAIVGEFRQAGFTTGAFVANNFSITGSPALFETFFGIAPTQISDATREHQLPLGTISPDLRSAIDAIVIPRRPDFGPGGNF